MQAKRTTSDRPRKPFFHPRLRLFTDSWVRSRESYEAYFDCSGRSDVDPGVVVGACVAPSDQWQRMEPDWNRILEQEGVKETGGYRALHMKDLAASRRAFFGWDSRQKETLLTRLAHLMRARIHFLIGRGMPISAYEQSQILLTRHAGWAPDPLTFAAVSAVEEAGRVAIEGDAADLSFTFEHGDSNQAELRKLMVDIESHPGKRANFRLGSWRFGDKSLVGLQAADWIAYETFLWGKRKVLPQYGEAPLSHLPMRKSIESLSNIPNKIVYFANTEEVLAALKKRVDDMAGLAGLPPGEYFAREMAKHRPLAPPLSGLHSTR